MDVTHLNVLLALWFQQFCRGRENCIARDASQIYFCYNVRTQHDSTIDIYAAM
jgi:hypothetical protein